MIPNDAPISDNARRYLERKAEVLHESRADAMTALELAAEELLEVELELYSKGIYGVAHTADGPALIWGQPR